MAKDNKNSKNIIKDIKEEEDSLIGQFVRIRKKKGITQSELGAQCGMPQSLIARFESGKSSPQLETFLRALVPLNARISLTEDGSICKCPVCGLEMTPEEEKGFYHTLRHQHAMEMIKRYGIFLKYDERELLKTFAYKLRYGSHLEMRILGAELLFFSWYMRAAEFYPYKSMKRFPDFENYIAMLLNCIKPNQKYPLDWMYNYGEDGHQKPDTELVETLILRYGQKEGLPDKSTDFMLK